MLCGNILINNSNAMSIISITRDALIKQTKSKYSITIFALLLFSGHVLLEAEHIQNKPYGFLGRPY